MQGYGGVSATESTIIDHIMDCNPNNSIVFILCDSLSLPPTVTEFPMTTTVPTIGCNLGYANTRLDIVLELRDEVSELYDMYSSDSVVSGASTHADKIIALLTIDDTYQMTESATVSTILRFLDIFIGDITKYFADPITQTKYKNRLMAETSLAYNNYVLAQLLFLNPEGIVLQLRRLWIWYDNDPAHQTPEVKTCRDIMNRCRYISLDVDNRLFAKMST
jgi:hypothetical protein